MASDVEFLVAPDPDDPALTRAACRHRPHRRRRSPPASPVERPLTLFLNGQEIVTMMTIGDRPDCLAVGYLLNQGMLRRDDPIERIDCRCRARCRRGAHAGAHRLRGQAAQETLTSGCAQGTAFGDLLERFEQVRLDPGGRTADQLALCAVAQDQHAAEPVSRRRRHPWLRAVRAGPAAGLHGGCRPPQRDRQDRRLDAAATASGRRESCSTPPAG